jgi:hypothetical protein
MAGGVWIAEFPSAWAGFQFSGRGSTDRDSPPASNTIHRITVGGAVCTVIPRGVKTWNSAGAGSKDARITYGSAQRKSENLEIWIAENALTDILLTMTGLLTPESTFLGDGGYESMYLSGRDLPVCGVPDERLCFGMELQRSLI